jgi:hypothetical protein
MPHGPRRFEGYGRSAAQLCGRAHLGVWSPLLSGMDGMEYRAWRKVAFSILERS